MYTPAMGVERGRKHQRLHPHWPWQYSRLLYVGRLGPVAVPARS